MLKITLNKNNEIAPSFSEVGPVSGVELCPKCNSEEVTKFYCKKCFWHFPKMKKGGKLHKGKNKLTRSLNSQAIADARSLSVAEMSEVEMKHYDDNEGLPYEF